MGFSVSLGKVLMASTRLLTSLRVTVKSASAKTSKKDGASAFRCGCGHALDAIQAFNGLLNPDTDGFFGLDGRGAQIRNRDLDDARLNAGEFLFVHRV